jgi:hypothetical protein
MTAPTFLPGASGPTLPTSGDRTASSAVRLDVERGVREEASFFGVPGARLFGTLYTPLAGARAGVVICCPIQAELLRNYRREVLLARTLAEHGVAVQRFHYRGSGHSDGDVAEATLETMIEDALLAADNLAGRGGVKVTAFFGTRLGGLVAGAAAGRRGGPLALWEPVTDAGRYIDEILRFRLMYGLQRGLPERTAAELREELRREGSVDVFGDPVARALDDGDVDTTLREAAGTGAQAVLLVQVAMSRTLRRDYRELAASWRERGRDVETHLVTDREAWWVSGDLWPIHENHGPTTRLVDLTRRWALRILGQEPR